MKTLDPIYHGGLRLVLGALRTSPAESLYAKANEASGNIRSCKLALQYNVKLKSCPTNPAHHKVFHHKYKELFQKNEKAIKHFGLWMVTIPGEAEVDQTEIHKTIIADIPPWTIRTPNIILKLCKFHKNKTHPLIFKEELEKVKEKYPKHLHIFTGGSKVDKITRCATINKGKIFKKHLPNDTSIFSAEACTINMALDLISESRNNKFIIFSDSLSVLESLKNRKFDQPLIIRILCKLKNLSNDNDIQICWVPSHTGINGNDQAARSTINLTTEKKFKIPHTDFKMKINKYIQQQR